MESLYLTKEASRASSLNGLGSSGLGSSSSSFGDGISPSVMLIAVGVALIAAILLFVLVVERKKGFKGKFGNWLREYLNFRSILIAGIIKFVYLFLSVLLTVMGIVMMCSGKDDTVLPMILTGLAIIIIGNVLLRVLMELIMAIIVMWENTSDIRLMLVKREERAAPVPVAVEKEPVVEEKPEPVVEEKSESAVEEKSEPAAEEVVVEQRQRIEVQEPEAKPEPEPEQPQTPPQQPETPQQ